MQETNWKLQKSSFHRPGREQAYQRFRKTKLKSLGLLLLVYIQLRRALKCLLDWLSYKYHMCYPHSMTFDDLPLLTDVSVRD